MSFHTITKLFFVQLLYSLKSIVVILTQSDRESFFFSSTSCLVRFLRELRAEKALRYFCWCSLYNKKKNNMGIGRVDKSCSIKNIFSYSTSARKTMLYYYLHYKKKSWENGKRKWNQQPQFPHCLFSISISSCFIILTYYYSTCPVSNDFSSVFSSSSSSLDSFIHSLRMMMIISMMTTTSLSIFLIFLVPSPKNIHLWK